MSKVDIHCNPDLVLIEPDKADYEVVERKFRGHPDSLADMVAQRFSQLYIQETWRLFPELKNKAFPNFSADKVTLSGATTKYDAKKVEVLKPVNALLIGKITKNVGKVSINVDLIFKKAINDILFKALGHRDFAPFIKRDIYAATLAGTDHNSAFYDPQSTKDLIKIIRSETFANDTVYVVAYAPLSLTEKLSISIENITDSPEFKKLFPEIGSDIKVMIRRRKRTFDITMCLPVFPEKVDKIFLYDSIVKNATEYLKGQIIQLLEDKTKSYIKVELRTNTKDKLNKKYFAVWGTALSKGDIGAVGRGNRQQGFISGIRPSTNEPVSGKNPNHFAGIVYQLIAEDIADTIFTELGLANVVYIAANNGDPLNNPNSIDILLKNNKSNETVAIKHIVNNSLARIKDLRSNFITEDVYERFMHPKIQ